MQQDDAAADGAWPLSVLMLNWRDSTNPEGGGSERYVEEVAAGLTSLGHSVTIMCARHPNAPANEVRGGVAFVRRGGKLSVYLHALAHVARRGGEFDVVVDVQNGVPFLSPLVRRRPVLVLVHHVHREQWPIVYPVPIAAFGWWLESWLAPRVYSRAPYVAVSSSTRDELARLGVHPDRVSVVHNGAEWVPASHRSRTAVDTPGPRLVVVSRLVPHKQVEHAIDAVVALQATYPTLSLDIVGDGWWRDRLERYAAGHGVADAVTFHGHLPELEKGSVLSAADLLVLPSVKEGWGLVVIEAAGYAVPAVAYTAAGGVSESIVHGQTGMLAEDHADLVAAIKALLDDPATMERMGAAAEERARTFSWDATVAGFEKALLTINAGGEPRRSFRRTLRLRR